MTKQHPLEVNHLFCEKCGSAMARVQHRAPSTYCRKTGVEKPGATWETWECPHYPQDKNHDREGFA